MTKQSATYILVLLLSVAVAAPAGQIDRGAAIGRPFYVLPLWLQYSSADEETFAREVQELRMEAAWANHIWAIEEIAALLP